MSTKNINVSEIKVFNYHAFLKQSTKCINVFGNRQVNDLVFKNQFFYILRGYLVEFMFVIYNYTYKEFDENDVIDKMMNKHFTFKSIVNKKSDDSGLIFPLKYQKDINNYIDAVIENRIDIRPYKLWSLALLFYIYSPRTVAITHLFEYMDKYFNTMLFDISIIVENIKQYGIRPQRFNFQRKYKYKTTSTSYAGIVDIEYKDKIIDLKCTKETSNHFILQVVQYAFLHYIIQGKKIKTLSVVNFLNGEEIQLCIKFNKKNVADFMRIIISDDSFKYNKLLHLFKKLFFIS